MWLYERTVVDSEVNKGSLELYGVVTVSYNVR